MEFVFGQHLHEALKKLRGDITRIAETLRLETRAGVHEWAGAVEGKLLARLSPEFPVTASICGGGSSGKSSLFNALVGEHLSPVGGSAGVNRRVLVSGDRGLFENNAFVSSLFEPFGCAPEPLENPQDLTTPGCPLYVANDAVPRNLVLLDTPDFDTGAKGVYINREISRQALDASDILIYIFTNSNYNNRDNTDFISRILTGIGMRKCFLVYRVYPGFEEAEVREHAMTVARNLYGEEAERSVLGIYRSDEDNEVAAGKRFMSLRPVDPKAPLFVDALKSVDSRTIRQQLLGSILEDALQKAREFLVQAEISHKELTLYHDALVATQDRCVQEALKHFPLDTVLRRFAEIWMAHDPTHVKAMRKAGGIIDLPFRVVFNAARRMIGKKPHEKTAAPEKDFRSKVKEDLVRALNRMHRRAVDAEISVSGALQDPAFGRMLKAAEQIRVLKGAGITRKPPAASPGDQGEFSFSVAAHPALGPAQEALRKRDWKSVLDSILSRRDVIFDLSDGIEAELNRLAGEFRHRMGLWSKIRQTFFAMLNVVPATAAITYVLSTGDPVGAAGVKVKLTGFFGLHDLYALVAIPATTGMKKADIRQLDAMLVPIVQAWLTDKLTVIRNIFEQEITGEALRAAQTAMADSAEHLERIEKNLDICSTAATA